MAQCWYAGQEKTETWEGNYFVPNKWKPAVTGKKFVECACGYRHSCCARNDGVLECKDHTDADMAGTLTYQVPASAQVETEIASVNGHHMTYVAMMFIPFAAMFLAYAGGHYHGKKRASKYMPLIAMSNYPST